MPTSDQASGANAKRGRQKPSAGADRKRRAAGPAEENQMTPE
jgi:hypothetical protein